MLLYLIIAYFISVFIVTYIYWKLDVQSKRLGDYLTIISMIGFIITFGLYYIEYLSKVKIKQLEDKKTKVHERSIQNQIDYFIEIDDRYLKHFPYLERLHDEIYDTPNLTNYMQPDHVYKYHEIHMSLILIEAIENTLNTLIVLNENTIDWDTPDNKEWLDTWREWFKSNIMQQNWKKFKIQFSSITATFIDEKIISYIKTIVSFRS